jgi:hypothetical protein
MLGDFLAILIFLTFSLSFLNGVMWATTLRPKALQNELIFVNRQKVLVFGTWQQLENSRNNSLLDKITQQKFCNKDQKFDVKSKKEKTESIKNLINKYRLQIDQTSQEIENSNYSAEIKTLIKDLVSSNQDYLHDLGNWQTEKFGNMDLMSNWQQKVNLFCTSELIEQKSQIEGLEKVLIKISDIPNIQNWQKNNQEWLMCAKKSIQEDWFNEKNKAVFGKELEDFKFKTNKVFELEFDNTNFGQKFLKRLESVENWEKERLRNLPKFTNSPKIEHTLIFFGNVET